MTLMVGQFSIRINKKERRKKYKTVWKVDKQIRLLLHNGNHSINVRCRRVMGLVMLGNNLRIKTVKDSVQILNNHFKIRILIVTYSNKVTLMRSHHVSILLLISRLPSLAITSTSYYLDCIKTHPTSASLLISGRNGMILVIKTTQRHRGRYSFLEYSRCS